jgi:hypothetical protein
MGSQRLERHLESHKLKRDDGSTVFVCTMCPGRFTKEVCLAHHTRDFHREEHCLACGSCFRGARRMQLHVAEHHAPEKMFRDVYVQGYDSPETFYQCSNCPKSFYEFFEAEHHFFTKHIVLGDCSEDLGKRPVNTWWPWAQLYPDLDIYADYRYFECELRSVRSNLRKKELELRRFDLPRVVCRKSAPDPVMLDEDTIEAVFYQCQICDDLFKDNDLLEEHLGHVHMATCFEFPEMMADEWRLVAPFKELDLKSDDLKTSDEKMDVSTNGDEESTKTSQSDESAKTSQSDESAKTSQDEEEMEISVVEGSPEKAKNCSDEKNLTISQVQIDSDNSKEVMKDSEKVNQTKVDEEPFIPNNVDLSRQIVEEKSEAISETQNKLSAEKSKENEISENGIEGSTEKSKENEMSETEIDRSTVKSDEKIGSSSKTEKSLEDSKTETKLPIKNSCNDESQKIPSEHSKADDATTETSLISSNVVSDADVKRDVSSCDTSDVKRNCDSYVDALAVPNCDEKSHSDKTEASSDLVINNVDSNNVDQVSSSDVKVLFAEKSKIDFVDKPDVELPTTNGIATEV